MILRILIALLICIVVIFVALWLLTGGLSRGLNSGGRLDNPFDFFMSTTTGVTLRLPGQPDELVPMIDVTKYTDEGQNAETSYSYSQSPEEQLSGLARNAVCRLQ